MKKVLAMAITVMMLLTMAVAMPVSADTAAEEVNLIKNGSFELDTDGDTDLDYWTQLNETSKMKAWTVTDLRYNPPTDGVNVAYAFATNVGISQTVDLTDTEYYTNWSKYGFVLTFESYKGNNYHIVGNMFSVVTMTTADGEAVSKTYAHTFNAEDLAGGTSGGVYSNTFDLLAQMDELTAPAKTITVTMQSATELSVDNIKLTPYEAVRVPNLIVNGSFEDDVDPNPGQANPPSGDTADYDLTPWTQLNDTVKMVAWATAPTSGFNPATNGSVVAYAKATGTFGLSQTVTLTNDSEYYTNQDAYKFVVSYDVYGGGGTNTQCIVTLTTTEGATITVPFAAYFSAADVVQARMYHNEFDLTEIFDSLALPAKTITITLQASNELCFDNVKLSPNPVEASSDLENMLSNASFENVTEGNPDSWRVLEYDNDLYSLYTSADGNIPRGSNAVKLTNVQGVVVNEETGQTANYGGTLTQNVTLEKGKYYQLKYKYVAALEEAALITISNTANWAKILEECAPASSVWTIDKKWIKAEEDMTVEISIRCHPNTAGAVVCYDDIRFTEVTDPDTDNLIFNGSFELDSVGDTTILGWNQLGQNDSYSVLTTTMGNVADGNNMIYYYDNVTAGTDAVLSQTIEITDFDYANMKNYNYELGFSIDYNYGGYPEVIVDIAFEDTTKNFTHKYIMGRTQAEVDGAGDGITAYLLPHGQASHQTFNLGDLYNGETPITSPITSITVKLYAQNWGAAWDNITLKCTNKPVVEIVDASGAAVTEVTTNAAAAYTAKATYYGTDTGAMAYIAVYTKDANGNLRLTSVANAAVAGDGVANTSAALTGINATAGTTVVKAFILGTNIEPIASATID